jgi:hypothetical protein
VFISVALGQSNFFSEELYTMNTLIEVGGSFKSRRLGLWCRPAQLGQISVMNTNGESKSVFPLGCFSAAVAELAEGGISIHLKCI